MKKCYQVYANCVRTTRPVRELNWSGALNLARDTLFEDWIDANRDVFCDVSEERVEDAICVVQSAFDNRVYEAFKAEETINCGDFCIIFSEEEPSRPNKCGFDGNLIFDPLYARTMIECFYINS